MEYYSVIKRNTFKSVLMRRMNLEPIIQSEVKLEREKKKYIYECIYIESRKMVLMNLRAVALRQGNSGNTDIENRLTDMGWGRKERVG